MIEVGVTAIADHPELAANGKTSTLADLTAHFPIIEIDTSFYALPKLAVVQRWQQQVPLRCRFIIKASQYMTLHKVDPHVDVVAQFTALKRAVAPLVASKQLAAILFQLPPFFGVTPANSRYLDRVRELFPELPIAVELRNNGWYLPAYRQATLAQLRRLRMIHVVVDEPQTPAGSVPMVAEATHPDLTIMRLHGRNFAGWQEKSRQWRSQRTNYRYSPEALHELGQVARQLASRDVAVIFNNNGGGDAAANALAFIAQEQLHYTGLGPEQLDLF
ncbi:DUF72 domain-containing protein [Lacticaseibacillus baoqingensis]|uniref:DUF72 domain-containing protein n=1 Tax=Lacticaseibacillus baoqingensis TaxID=2486013 RepID=A0ABW4ECJ8_9LACO|nr:DUF72 domain-containing protein [Lacticaseibacillus baoqingensis]